MATSLGLKRFEYRWRLKIHKTSLPPLIAEKREFLSQKSPSPWTLVPIGARCWIWEGFGGFCQITFSAALVARLFYGNCSSPAQDPNPQILHFATFQGYCHFAAIIDCIGSIQARYHFEICFVAPPPFCCYVNLAEKHMSGDLPSFNALQLVVWQIGFLPWLPHKSQKPKSHIKGKGQKA